MSDEDWRPVVKFEGLYEVSDRGRVRSVDRVIPHRKYGQMNARGQVLRLRQHPDGHLRVNLSKSSAVLTRWVHVLVLEAFVGPCPAGMEGCHFDGDPTNNALANLRWDTREGNWHDRKRHAAA